MDIRDASDQQLVAELESRGFFSRLAGMLLPKQQILAGPSEPRPGNKPGLGRFITGTDRPMPKGAQSVVNVPDRTNKDGSQLRMITVSGPGATEDPKPQFIVKGSEREKIAHDFISQWENEIAALNNRLEAEMLPQDEIDAIWNEINRLQGQIALRSTSAFGSMGIEEVRARNIALNGEASVMDAKSEPGVAGRGVKIETTTGFAVFDAPSRADFAILEAVTPMAKELAQILQWDPFVLHLPQPVFAVKSVGRNVIVDILMEPIVLWRALTHLQVLCKRKNTPLPDSILASMIERLVDEAAIPGQPTIRLHAPDPAAVFQSNWTSTLLGRLRSGVSDHIAQGIKRTVRILNVDFQEQEAPDFMFETGTDGANPLGTESRPHVNPRDAWASVEESPGVFKMSRKPLDRTDLDEDDDQ